MNAENVCISVKQVYKSFGKKKVLFNIDLDIAYSQIFGLLGPSGSGKTTLIKLIGGYDIATSGDITLLDIKMPNLKIMNKIGYMSQADALYGDITAEENLKFFASMYKMNSDNQKRRIKEVAELVDLSGDIKRKVNQFSGGMKRRLSLAIALLMNPPVLILDEPTVGIDPMLRKTIWDELYKLRDSGTTIIVTTHVMNEAEKCDTLGMVREGRLIAVGSPEYLKEATKQESLEQAFLYYGGNRK